MITRDENEEIDLFLEEVHTRWGFDFREYTRSSLRRRILNAKMQLGCTSIAELRQQAVQDAAFFSRVVSSLTVNVTEMFRDPQVYARIKEELIPILRTYPSIRIWHAGCSTGEEVYSMAIMLKEAGLYEKSFLYATDISPKALEQAKSGAYPAEQMRTYTANYYAAGGSQSFADYYTADKGQIKLDDSLKKNILFAPHNLTADQVFSEVHVVFCRNVLIYFSKPLQEKVLGLFHESLIRRGFLILGTKETTEFTPLESAFEKFDRPARIYRKVL